jgi:hypothetical protein
MLEPQFSFPPNAAIARNFYHNIYERVRLASDIFRSASVLTVGVSRISTTLVTRLVLNLRERALSQLPTTVETERRWQAGLPVARRPMTSIQNPSSVRPNRSKATGEMVAVLAVGESRSQTRSADAIGYETERRFQVARQPSTSVRSPSSVRQNRSAGETASVGTAGASGRGADETRVGSQSSR